MFRLNQLISHYCENGMNTVRSGCARHHVSWRTKQILLTLAITESGERLLPFL